MPPSVPFLAGIALILNHARTGPVIIEADKDAAGLGVSTGVWLAWNA
jgi:hypothetical protein